MKYLAHQDQPLAIHLKAVAERAKVFASFFGAAEHGWLAGLLHDLGKAEAEFQKRVRSEKGKEEPHAHHGAALLLKMDEDRGGPVWPVAFAINAHHAGLHDRTNLQKRLDVREKALAAELRLVGDPDWNGVGWPVPYFADNLPTWLHSLPAKAPQERAAKMRAVDLYTRFLFSALVDADRLDTEQQAPETNANYSKRHAWRFGSSGLATNGAPDILLGMLEAAIQQRKQAAEEKHASSDVLEVRTKVLDCCAATAGNPRGIFTLTVPTGGGKTLASVYFALKHIAAHNKLESAPFRRLRRIIVVIPFLNLIQQTATELKSVFNHIEDDPIVLEHHSQAQDQEPPKGTQAEKRDSDDYSRERTLRQLAAENWEAPIVVTTSVQFFDSLFSRRPADARKLHNIAESVVIFDEVQTFPPRLMQPILDALVELTNPERPYGCSLVLCTATQPALVKSDDIPYGLENVEHIVKKPELLFTRLKRTTYPELESKDEIPRRSWPEVVTEVVQSPSAQALIVVNTRRDARRLFDEFQGSASRANSAFHLSTWMTPAHRNEVLNEVRRRLDAGGPCFLVSTQCIEAGVDVDFPCVWRALGPYDSIVQAAGRCNRNGRLKAQDAKVHVFRTEDDRLPAGLYQTATNQTELLRQMAAADPHNPDSFDTYFRLLYQLTVPDECEIQREREQLHFEQVHERFNFIEAFTVPIIVAEYALAGSRIALRLMCEQAAQKGFFTPAEWQLIQPHIVHLDYRDKKTASFNRTGTVKMFRDDDELTGVRRLTHFSAYDGGPHGHGLDVEEVGTFEILL